MARNRHSRKMDNIVLLNSARVQYDAAREAENNTFGLRLREARNNKGVSLAAVAEALQDFNIYVKTAAVSKWEQGVNTPSPYQMFALCYLYDIPDALHYFAENAINQPELNATGLIKLMDYREDLIASGRYKVTPSEQVLSFPLYVVSPAAGTGNFLDSDYHETASFPESEVPSGTDYVLHVSGDSMMPDYKDGQILFIQKTECLSSGEVGIFLLNGDSYIKEYRVEAPDIDSDNEEDRLPQVTLVSRNENYKPIPVHAYDDLRILGRVLN